MMSIDHDRRQRSLRFAAATAAFSLLASAAAAADQTNPADAPTAETIVVSASRGKMLEEMDVSTQVLNRKQIEQMPETSLEEILGRIPGIVMPQLPANELHPTGDPIEIRGFGSTPGRTLIMVDGVPFNDPFFRYVDWQKIPKEEIERIEVIRGGGATTLWGNMAMAGTINIVTREPSPGEARASIGYGSYNTFNTDAAATLFSSDLLRIGSTFSHNQTDGFDKVPSWQNSPIFGPTSSYSNDGTVSAYLTPQPGQKFYLKLGAHYMAETGLQEAVASNAWGTYDAKFGGTVTLADKSVIEANGFFEKWHYATNNATDQCYNQFSTRVSASSGCPGNVASPATASSFLGQVENAPYTTVGGAAVWKPRLAPELRLSDVMAGVDSRITGATDEISVYTRANPLSAIIARPYVEIHGQHQFEGLFAQATYSLEAIPLDVTIGLREDFWQATDGSVGSTPLADHTFTHFDPRLGLKYSVTPAIALRGAVYESFAAPGMNQSYRSFLSSSSLTLGNTGLQPETNLGGEGGIQYKAHGVSVEANGFYNQLSNFIQSGKLCNSATACGTVAIPSVFGAASAFSSITKNFNAGDAEIAGTEILAGWQVLPSLYADASWTRTMAVITNNTELAGVLGSQTAANTTLPTNQQLGGVPAWTAVADLRWEPLANLELTGSLRSWPNFWNGTAHATSGLNSGATVVDLGASYRFLDHYQLFLTAQNIGSVTYITSAYNSGAGTGSPSSIGTPFLVFGGLRAAF